MIISICAFTSICASAQTSGACGDNLTWVLDDKGTLTISGTGPMDDWSGYPVTTPWINYDNDISENIKHVIIESGVSNISNYAFYGCKSIETVSIPDSVTFIGENSFFKCESLKSINIPAFVSEIDKLAFNCCYALENFSVDAENTSFSTVDGNLYSKNGTSLIMYASGSKDSTFGNGLEQAVIHFTDASTEQYSDGIFKDIFGYEYYAPAALELANKGILYGYQDGKYHAFKAVTRAEMAAIICRMIGKENEANNSKGHTDFYDVDVNHWASGYINIAAKEGIISGDGNGSFRPGDDVKHEEVVKMIVCALNIEDQVTHYPDNWALGYLDVADVNGITENIIGDENIASTRSDVSVMVYNGLNITY